MTCLSSFICIDTDFDHLMGEIYMQIASRGHLIIGPINKVT